MYNSIKRIFLFFISLVILIITIDLIIGVRYNKSIAYFKKNQSHRRSLIIYFYSYHKKCPKNFIELINFINPDGEDSTLIKEIFKDKFSDNKSEYLLFLLSNEDQHIIFVSTGIDGCLDLLVHQDNSSTEIPFTENDFVFYNKNKKYIPGKYIYNRIFGDKDLVIQSIDLDTILEKNIYLQEPDKLIDDLNRRIFYGKIVGLREISVSKIYFGSVITVNSLVNGYEFVFEFPQKNYNSIIGTNDKLDIVGFLDSCDLENKYISLEDCRVVPPARPDL